MKSYLSLVPISARVHRRQSRMTRICIILAVFLVTSIFSMAEMWIRMERIVLTRKHGDAHAIITVMKNVYPLAVICFLLILIAGILMISSCMNSTVAQRTSFFGMMRCIGASRQQIMHFVRLEALNWCKTAIPTGCLLGMAACWIACAVLHFFARGEWTDMPLFGVSISGIVCGISVGLITVLIAAQSPAKQAAKVSPIIAVSGNTEPVKKTSRASSVNFFKVETALGLHHAAMAKKNLFLMTGSFALTIILFFVFAACLDIVHRLLPSESNFSPDVAVASADNTNSIDKRLTEQIAAIPGVKQAFGTIYEIALPAKINGSETVIDLMSYEAFLFENTKKSVVSGSLATVYEASDQALTIFSENSSLDVGDQIQIGDQTIRIACVASEGIGSLSGSPVVICSEDTIARLMGEQDYMMINVILEKKAPETTVKQIHDLAARNDALFVDRREEDRDMHSAYWAFRIAAYGFLGIVSFITVLNITNSVSMGVSARIKQYGIMRAIGMNSWQITKMIMGEAFTYACCGTLAGIFFGLLLHYLLFIKLINTHFGGIWKIPVSTIIIVLALVSASCLAAVYAPARRIRNMAITETINEL